MSIFVLEAVWLSSNMCFFARKQCGNALEKPMDQSDWDETNVKIRCMTFHAPNHVAILIFFLLDGGCSRNKNLGFDTVKKPKNCSSIFFSFRKKTTRVEHAILQRNKMEFPWISAYLHTAFRYRNSGFFFPQRWVTGRLGLVEHKS